MGASRLIVAKGLAISGLVLILTNVAIGALWPLAAHTSGMIVGAIGAFASTGAFFFALKRKTILVPALMAVGGMVLTVYSVLNTGNLAILISPGPILGFAFGVAILAMSAALMLVTRESKMTTTASRKMIDGRGY